MAHAIPVEDLPKAMGRYEELLEKFERELNSARLLEGFNVSPVYLERWYLITTQIADVLTYRSEQDKVVRYNWANSHLGRLIRQLEEEQLRFIKQRAWLLRKRYFAFRRQVRSSEAQPHLQLLARECECWVHSFLQDAQDKNATLQQLRPKLVSITLRMSKIESRL